MAKQARWQNEDVSFSNPFAALQKPESAARASADAPAPSVTKVSASLPVAKSARIERAHRGGKTVTVVSFAGTPDEAALTAWLKKMKTTLGVGGSVEEDHVVLQGDQVERLGLKR